MPSPFIVISDGPSSLAAASWYRSPVSRKIVLPSSLSQLGQTAHPFNRARNAANPIGSANISTHSAPHLRHSRMILASCISTPLVYQKRKVLSIMLDILKNAAYNEDMEKLRVDSKIQERIESVMTVQGRRWDWLAYRIRVYTGRPMDQGRLHRILHGFPSHYLAPREQEAIADALGVPEDILFRGDGHEPS